MAGISVLKTDRLIHKNKGRKWLRDLYCKV